MCVCVCVGGGGGQPGGWEQGRLSEGGGGVGGNRGLELPHSGGGVVDTKGAALVAAARLRPMVAEGRVGTNEGKEATAGGALVHAEGGGEAIGNGEWGVL